jgi:hypothetical protein
LIFQLPAALKSSLIETAYGWGGITILIDLD